MYKKFTLPSEQMGLKDRVPEEVMCDPDFEAQVIRKIIELRSESTYRSTRAMRRDDANQPG